MKTIYMTLFLLALAVWTQAQQSTSTLTPGYWTFGINGGWAYQSSDVSARLNGYGVGLTLGKNLYYRPGAPLAFDLRGRLLFTQQYGLNTFRSYDIVNNTAVNGTGSLNYLRYPSELQENQGFIFANHQTTTGELALEGLITLNNLRERTGVHVGLFGGIGLDWFRAKTDQANGNGNEYFKGYSEIKEDDLLRSYQIKAALKNILDADYETIADGNNAGGSVKLMPSLGIELGYQITPSFLIYGGHRTTFSGTDILDGQQFKNANQDLYHYTNFGLRWTIDPPKDEPLARKPEIDVIAPFGSPYTTNSAVVTVIADIRYVNSAADVECLVNGRSVPFDYKNGRFSINTDLNIGNNDVMIIARNEAGQARRNVIMVYKNQITEQPIVKAPVIRITNPTYNNYRTEGENFIIKAILENVQSAQEVVFTVNNVDRNFDLNNMNFSANITLREGENEIEIRARNSAGIDVGEIIIIREIKVALPTVEVTEPNVIRSETRFNTARIAAKAYNIQNKNDINFLVNGRPVYNFDYDVNRGIITSNLNLEKGANTVVITVRNRAGEARDEATIVYQEPVISRVPPVVRISEPLNNSETANAWVDVRARVGNISNNRDINFVINGRSVYDFNYNVNAQQLTARVNLIEGNNTVSIRANNADGSDEQTVNVRYRRNLNPPHITIHHPVNNLETQNAYADLRASIGNIKNRNDINIRLNDVPFYDFDFNPTTRQLTAQVGLYEGNNAIEISARNADGSDAAVVNVRYRKVQPPTVQILEPVNNFVTKTETILLRARIETWDRRYTIKVLVNGVPTANYTLKGKELAANVTLREGENTLAVQVSNTDGKAEAKVAVRHEIVKKPPLVTWVTPQNGASLKNGKVNVRAIITNVSSAHDVIFRINDKVVQEFALEGENFTAIINLQPGNNVLTLSAQNADGSAEARTQVAVAALVAAEPLPLAPSVVFIQPSAPGTVVTEKAFSVVANIRNVQRAEEVRLWVNGKAWTELEVNPRSRRVTAQVELESGENTLRIAVQTAAGKAEDATRVLYQVAEAPAKPVIEILSIAQTASDPFKSNAGGTTLVAKALHVSAKEALKILLNNQEISDFRFDAASKMVEANLNLQRGENTLLIRASNEAGTSELTRKIDY